MTHRAFLCFVLAGLITAAVDSAGADERLPVEQYAAIPAAESARMSPDGSKLAVISAVNGRQAIVIHGVQGGNLSMALGDWQADWVAWKSDQRLIAALFQSSALLSRALPRKSKVVASLFAIDSDGSHVVDIGAPASVVFQPRIEDRVAALMTDDPHHIVQILGRTGLDRVDVDTGEHIGLLLRPGPHILNYRVDQTGLARLGVGLEGTDQVVFTREDVDSDWRLVYRNAVDGPIIFSPQAFVPGQPSQLYVMATGPGAGPLGLWTFDTGSATWSRLIDADVADAPDPEVVDGRLISYVDRAGQRKYLDPAWERDVRAAQSQLPGQRVDIVDRADDGSHVFFAAHAPQTPDSWWMLDRTVAPNRFFRIIETYPQLARAGLAAVVEVRYTARDGLTIPAYLTLPRGRIDGPIPFVILPHDGPRGCDRDSFDTEAQFLASRGWGVLQPEYRGSSCLGAAFERRGDQQWGYAMQDDVTDGTRWLIDHKLADPRRICIVGSGYGGYAALEGVEREPALYRCAAAWAPITDLNNLRIETIKSGRPNGVRDVILDRLGTDRERLRLASPVDHADRITVPVLLMHGRNDFTVQVYYTEWMESALKAAGKPVEAIYLDDADHFRRQYPARLAWLQALERFLGAHLAEPG